MNKLITFPDYYVDTKDKRHLESKERNCARSFGTLEELVSWVSKNKDKVCRVHWKSEDPWTHALGKTVEEFAEYLLEKNVEIYKKTHWKDVPKTKEAERYKVPEFLKKEVG